MTKYYGWRDVRLMVEEHADSGRITMTSTCPAGIALGEYAANLKTFAERYCSQQDALIRVYSYNDDKLMHASSGYKDGNLTIEISDVKDFGLASGTVSEVLDGMGATELSKAQFDQPVSRSEKPAARVEPPIDVQQGKSLHASTETSLGVAF